MDPIADWNFPDHEPVSAIRPGCARAARALLADQIGTPADAPELRRRVDALAGFLHQRLGVWIGTDGCAVLLRRAWSRAALDHPVLTRLVLRGAPPYVDWPAAELAMADVVAAVDAVLVHAFDHLGRLVGDEVAARLLLPEHVRGWDAEDPSSGDDR